MKTLHFSFLLLVLTNNVFAQSSILTPEVEATARQLMSEALDSVACRLLTTIFPTELLA